MRRKDWQHPPDSTSRYLSRSDSLPLSSSSSGGVAAGGGLAGRELAEHGVPERERVCAGEAGAGSPDSESEPVGSGPSGS